MVKRFGLTRWGERTLSLRFRSLNALWSVFGGADTPCAIRSFVRSACVARHEVPCFHREHVRLPSAPVSPGPQIPDNMPEVQNKAQVHVALANAQRTLGKQNWNMRQATICAWQSPSLGWGGGAGPSRLGGRLLLVWNGVGLTEFPGFQILFQKFPYFIPVVFNMKL